MNQNVRKITDGAMMAAIVGVMLVINRQTAGLLESMLLFAFPLPMVFYAAKYGLKQSIAELVAITLLSFIISTPQTMFYVVTEMLIGLIYGAGIHDRKPSGQLVLITIILSVIVNLVTTVVAAEFFGYDIGEEISMYMEMIDQVQSSTGMTSPVTDMHAFLMNIVVVSTVLLGVMQGLITHLLSRLMLKRLRIYMEPMKPLIEYFPPKWSGYAGIVCVIMYAVSVYRPLENSYLNNAMQAIGISGMLYLAFFGYIVLTFVLRYLGKLPKGITIIVSILMLMLFSMPMAIFGFLYITTDYHERLIHDLNS